MFKIILASCVTVAAVCAQTLKAGLKTSLDIAVLEQAKDVYFDKILSLINGMTLPDLDDGHGNYLHDNSLEILERTSAVEFVTDVAKNAVVLKNKKISAIARTGDFRYKAEPLLVAKGHAEVDMNTVDIEAGLSFSTRILPSGHVVPYVTAVDVKCNINRFDINIKLWGNFWTDLASLAEVFFVGTVAGLIEDVVVLTLDTEIPAAFNVAIGYSNGYFPMPVFNNWVVDWQTPEAATVTDTYIGIGVKGLYFDSLIGEEEPAVAIPDMPYHLSTHPEQFQTYVSAYDIDGFFNSLLEVTNVGGWIRASEIPATTPFQLTTTQLNVLLPGILSYYGAGLPVDIHFKIYELSNWQSFEGNQEMTALATIELQFWVRNTDSTLEMAADLMLNNIEIGFIAPITNMSLTISITRINVGSVNVISDTFGKLSGLVIRTEINNGFRIVQPSLNEWLTKKTVNFPTHILGVFELQQMTLSYYDNYLYVGITPVFVAPSKISTEIL